MKYFSFKNVIIGEPNSPERTELSLNIHNLHEKSKTYTAKDRYNDLSCVSVDFTANELKEFKAAQPAQIKLTEINQARFNELKLASYTYEREQEILNELKQKKLQEIQKERDARLSDSPLQIAGIGTVDAGRNHLQNINSLIKICEATSAPSLAFRLRDNTSAQLTLEQLKLIELEMGKAAAMIYQKCWQLCEAINTASDWEAVQNIKWSDNE